MVRHRRLVSRPGLSIMPAGFPWKMRILQISTAQRAYYDRFTGTVPGARGLLLCACLSVLTLGCAESAPPSAPAEEVSAEAAARCVSDGHLQTELTGEIRASIDWDVTALVCEGMRRPDDEGARLRFSGPAPASDPTENSSTKAKMLTFIIGLPYLGPGVTGKELPSNVTLVEEGAGRFFATSDAENCWTDVLSQEAIEPGSPDLYRVAGIVYCIAPLAEINGGSSVTFTELAFAGQVNWEHME